MLLTALRGKRYRDQVFGECNRRLREKQQRKRKGCVLVPACGSHQWIRLKFRGAIEEAVRCEARKKREDAGPLGRAYMDVFFDAAFDSSRGSAAPALPVRARNIYFFFYSLYPLHGRYMYV